MSFPQRNKNFSGRDSNIKKLLPILVVVFLIVTVSTSWMKNIIFTASTPLWMVKNSINYFFANNIALLKSKTSLLSENQLLKDQIKSKEIDTALFDVLKKENDDLKNILSRKIDDKKLILGTVLVKPFLSPYDTLIIDVGLSNGIAVGNQVLADGNTFIGYISEVYDHTSKVVLYSSNGEKVKVLIGDNNIEKEAIGLGSGNFEVEMPRDAGIKEGDYIVMPSISANIFGVVEKIEFKESDSFQKVVFKNPINVSELKWVEVQLVNKK